MKKWLNEPVICASAPSVKERLTMRFLIFCGLISMIVFVSWFFSESRMGYAPLYWPLTIIMFYKLYRMLHEWYSYYNISVPAAPELTKTYKVDVLTTFCAGEPYEMIVQTLEAMQAIRYPHTSYLCDEADDPYLREVCEKLGVVHVTREKKINAKAGNINNALSRADGDLCVILDPDHIPHPDFLDRVVAYFEDPAIGYVQVVQAYYNHRESLVAMGAAEQTYHFYGPMMMCMNSNGTAQAIGANCTFRREALDSIGGHAPGLAEDLHTSMLLHAKGWKSLYVPEVLSKGLVPASLSGYYKQQLKWSRGCFDLLFYVVPRIFKNLTWRQRFHYISGPLYFLCGVVDFVNILIPVLALVLAEFPWKVDLQEFTYAFLPMFAFSLLVRQYSQRWLLEKHEKGFHIIGGFLRIGTWWIYSIGFLYTIFRINVPYIPTPKDDTLSNEWKICFPNIVTILLTIASIVYGLSIDWNPYALFMAVFAFVNVSILTSAVLIGQHSLITSVRKFITGTQLRETLTRPLRVVFWKVRFGVYGILRTAAPILGVVLVASVGYLYYQKDSGGQVKMVSLKDYHPFYAGLNVPEYNNERSDLFRYVTKAETDFSTTFAIISIRENWDTSGTLAFPTELIRKFYRGKRYTFISWAPYASKKEHGENVFKSISEGKFDAYLIRSARSINDLRVPVFMSFSPEPDNPESPWYKDSKDNAFDYIHAWQHIVKVFNDHGVINVAWVWQSSESQNINTYYPGDNVVDWIGITCLNYDSERKEIIAADWKKVEEVYLPYRKAMASNNLLFRKPVMLTIPSVNDVSVTRSALVHLAINEIRNRYPEVHSVICHSSLHERFILNKGTYDENIFRKLKKGALQKSALSVRHAEDSCSAEVENSCVPGGTRSKAIKESAGGSFTWYADGKPYYMKGVDYNFNGPDGPSPYIETRSSLTRDFEKIRAMGGNTISRFYENSYDGNILNIANEYDMKVLFNIPMSTNLDYLRDSSGVRKLDKEMQGVIQAYKDKKSIVGWGLGGAVWNVLADQYHQPYLTEVRRAYLSFLENTARRIHKLDPSRPVVVQLNFSAGFAAALQDFHEFAPSVDVIGVSAWEEKDMAQVRHAMQAYDRDRAYIFTQFGPRSEKYDYDEEMDYYKGERYFWKWVKYVEMRKGQNLGAVAYTWQDRYDGIATWYGITDFNGRLKAPYYELKKIWTGSMKGSAYFPKVSIKGADTTYLPAKNYEFRLTSLDPLRVYKTAEWYLSEESRFDPFAKEEAQEAPFSAQMKMPSLPGKYRLYLYLTDEAGNVVTASKGIVIK